MVSHQAPCALPGLCCNGHSLLSSSYHPKSGRIKNPSCRPAEIRFTIPLISFCTVQLRTLCAARSLAIFCLSKTSGPRNGELPGFWSSMVFRYASIPRKGSNNNNKYQAVFDAFNWNRFLSTKRFIIMTKVICNVFHFLIFAH